MTQCKFCNKVFSSKSSLGTHQKYARYCLRIQGKELSDKFSCECGKKFTTHAKLQYHQRSCTHQLNNDHKLALQEVANLRVNNEVLKAKLIQRSKDCENLGSYIATLQKAMQEITLTAVRQNNKELLRLTKKYAKKQPRTQYAEKHVIYILTTKLLKTERRYILGKATNLTNRLSTYNKTDEHEVIYYKA